MAFDFPSTPPEGTVFSPVGGPTWTFVDGVWHQTGPTDDPNTASPDDFGGRDAEHVQAAIDYLGDIGGGILNSTKGHTSLRIRVRTSLIQT